MTPEELAQRQVNHEVQDELIDAIWGSIRSVARGYDDKVAFDAVISALEIVKTKHIIDVAVAKAVDKIMEVKDATI